METNFIIVITVVILLEVTYLLAVNTKSISRRKTIRPIFVDTSVLIDGRIIAVAQSGFIDGVLSIPRSVIGELQFLADHADTDKRTRARHGLDVVTELQKMPGVKVEIFQDGSKAEEGVDERLLKLAKQYDGAICTIDYNLNKVAQVENIAVLNVNDLAMNLRMAYLPGEKILLELTQKGQDAHQAVGHLTDGTMVVIEHASSFIGQTVEIEFIRSLQTAAGKMMFAKLTSDKKAPVKQNNKPVNNRQQREKPVKNIQSSPKPVVFHSDKSEQRFAKQNNQKRQRTNLNRSEQNEQDLIDLLNNQQR